MTVAGGNDDALPGSSMRVTVAMLTFQRPHLLAVAVEALRQACVGYPRSEILIVDNDPEGSAEPVIREMVRLSGPPSIQYVHEPRPGISAARNRALDEADCDILIFIDDDEVPSPGWLPALLEVYCATRPTAVVGPVRHEFEVTPDPWIVAGEFFIRRRNRTGVRVDEAPSNNLLLDLSAVRALGTRFDDRFGLTGGEDSLFTKQLVRGGGTIAWCDEAEVVDQVPRSRTNRQWVIRRAFRLGNTKARVDLALADSRWSRMVARVRYATHGLVRLSVGALRSAWGTATRSVWHQARGVRTATRGAGMLSGAFGYVYAEYERKAPPEVSALSAQQDNDGPIPPKRRAQLQ